MGLFDTIFNKKARAAEFYQKGNDFLYAGNYREALKAYGDAIKINPEFVDPWVNQGLAYQKLRQHQKAIASFEEAVRINPRSQNALYNMGVSYGELDQNDEAVRWYNQLLSLYPDDEDAIFNKYVCLGKSKKLEAELRTDARFACKIYFVLINEGLSLRKRDYPASNKKFLEALNIDPNESWLWFQIGLNYFIHNEPTRAIEAFDKAIAIKPFSEVYHLKYECLNRLGDEEAAKACKELSGTAPLHKDIGTREIVDLCRL